MASKKITVDVDIDIEPSLKALKQLKQQLKDTAAGSAEFKKITNQIKDVEDALEEAKVGSEGWLDALENSDGVLGLFGKGIRQIEIAFSSFNTALKASVIGLIAAAVAGLVAAFTESEVAMKKLQPIFIALEKILGGIFRAFEPVLDSFVELATDILPYVTKGIGMFYSGVFALFTYIKTAGGAVIDFWKSLLTLDFEGAGNAIKKGLGSFQEAGKAYTETMQRFTAGTQEMTKTEKENADKLAEIEKQKKEDRDKALQDKISNMEQNDKLDIAYLEKQKAIALSLAKTEQEKLNVEEKFAKLSYNIRRKDIEDKRSLYDKGSKEYKDYTTQILELETGYIQTTEDNSKKRKDIEEKNVQEINRLNQESIKLFIEFRNQKELLEVNAIEDEAEKASELLRIRYEQEKIQFQDFAFQYLELQEELLKNKEITQEDYDLEELETQEALDGALLQLELNYGKNLEKIEKDAADRERNERIKEYDEQLQLLSIQSQGLIQNTKAYFQNRSDIIDASENKELESAEENEEKILAIQKKYAQQRIQLKQDELAATGKIISETIDSIANLTNVLASSYDKEAETSEKAFNQRKKLQKATALMSAASGIIQILTQPSTLPSPFDFIVKGINAAALGISTAVQIKNIDKTTFQAPESGSNEFRSGPIQVQRRAKGGMINGPGTSTSDSIPALLSNGEFVVNARATESFQPLLSAINNFGLQPRFAAGGLFNTSSVNTPSNNNMNDTLTSIMSNQPIRTYVTANEITSQQQFDRVIKTRSLI